MDYTAETQTIGWYRDRYLEGTLLIRPPYQRKPVWRARQKCALIESVLDGYPIPEVFVQRDTDGDGNTTYALVDGQQRIRSILQFVGADESEGEEEFNKFALDKLDPDSSWYGTSFDDLDPDSDRRRFFGYKLATRFLETSDESELKQVFRRLNKYTVPLKPQELRNATYEGPFARLADKLAEDYSDILAEYRIVTAESIRRMGDIEFMAELLIGVMHGPQGGSPRSIDDYYSEYEDYETEFPGQRRARRIFDLAMETVSDVVGELIDTRWTNKNDFYTLFVAIASFVRQGRDARSRKALLSALEAFAAEVDEALEFEEGAEVDANIRRYVQNVQRGANDKTRRAERHAVLLETLEPAFK